MNWQPSLNVKSVKKVIIWSGNFGMDQYVSWGLSKEEMNLDTIWERFEDLQAAFIYGYKPDLIS